MPNSGTGARSRTCLRPAEGLLGRALPLRLALARSEFLHVLEPALSDRSWWDHTTRGRRHGRPILFPGGGPHDDIPPTHSMLFPLPERSHCDAPALPRSPQRPSAADGHETLVDATGAPPGFSLSPDTAIARSAARRGADRTARARCVCKSQQHVHFLPVLFTSLHYM